VSLPACHAGGCAVALPSRAYSSERLRLESGQEACSMLDAGA
jgi:hypothetical protein